MSDLFHDHVKFDFIDNVFCVIYDNPQHTFQILTKRADNLYSYSKHKILWPDNLWIGVTIENQDNIDRLDDLINTDVKVKFISYEPLLSQITFPKGSLSQIDWVIVGGESGPHARPMKKEWVLDISDQCRKAGVPFFFKQWGGLTKSDWLDGKQYHEFPKINL
jgi:protein gp37